MIAGGKRIEAVESRMKENAARNATRDEESERRSESGSRVRAREMHEGAARPGQRAI